MACVNHPERDAAAQCVECGDELCAECRQVGPDGKSYCVKHLPASASGQPAVEMPVATGAAESTGLAAACYFSWIVFPLSLVLPAIPLTSAQMKQSRFMRQHAWNGLFWGLAVIAVVIVLHVVLWIGGHLGLPWILTAPLRLVRVLWGVGALVASIIFAVRASNRQPVRIPLISDLADSQVK